MHPARGEGPLSAVFSFGAEHVAAAVVRRSGVLAEVGEATRPFAIASVTKLLSAYASLVALEEGCLALDEPAGPPGATVAHLLAHASGLGFEGSERPVAPGRRRIYSNAGFEALGRHLESRSGMTFGEYLDGAVFEPLGMTGSTLAGSPAYAVRAPLNDLSAFARELLSPTLIGRATHDLATRVAFPGLAGVVPGFGRFDPCDWGLGIELKGEKRPHWTGETNSPATFGHFGMWGSFLLVDPVADLALVALSDREFGPWAKQAWPPLCDAVLAFYRQDATPPRVLGDPR